MTRIAITGANGFIGKNLVVRLLESRHEPVSIPRGLDVVQAADLLSSVDAVVHLAGANRPDDDTEFMTGNVGTTQTLVKALAGLSRRLPVLFASSIQAERDSPYGRSKRLAEAVLEQHATDTGAEVAICRLPNVFGKWCRPNYNSVVATFCYNISRGIPIAILDPTSALRLVYIDDVVEAFMAFAVAADRPAGPVSVSPIYQATVGELATQLEAFRDSRRTLLTGAVGTGFLRALHATYVSYLEPTDFAYKLTSHTDSRGTFVEMLRTTDSGQFAFFTAHAGSTRGGHYHHTKAEKFLVVQGTALFGFRNILTNQTHEIIASSSQPRVVETVPGWSHDITNIGEGELVVMLWANEVFDPGKPDTIPAEVIGA